MDLLSDVLKVVSLQSAIYFNAEFSNPWCVHMPRAPEVAPLLKLDGFADHVIIFHLLCDGEAYVQLDDGVKLPLRSGDIVAFPHGHGHLMGGGGLTRPMEAREALPMLLAQGLELARAGGGGPPSAHLICGFLACEPRLSRSFLDGMPPLLVVNVRDDAAGQWLENSLKFSVAEAVRKRPGAEGVLAKLSEVVFAETLRRYIRDLPEPATGWLAGTRNPDVNRALTILHRRYAEPWTVAALAREVAMSRTVLTERFRHFLDVPPMTYLTRWRLRLGARALTTSSRSVAEIAADVGYESEAAFNRAFKREYGLPPARYRKASRTMTVRE
jgi:AraC-like DNA-binding protein